MPAKKKHLTPAQALGTPWWSQVKHFFGLYTGHDSNMADARAIGVELCPQGLMDEAALSDLLWRTRDNVEKVERLVLGPIMRGADSEATFRAAPSLLGVDASTAGAHLRNWAGCMSAAKTIAIGTRAGRNWPWWRRRISVRIEEMLEKDTLYAMGVLSAVAFKIGRDEPYSFVGVPRRSPIRRGAVARLGRLPEPDSHAMRI